MAWLQQCDVFIAEVSGSFFGLGFEAGWILGSTQERAVLLYRQDLGEKLSLLISGNSHINCTPCLIRAHRKSTRSYPAS